MSTLLPLFLGAMVVVAFAMGRVNQRRLVVHGELPGLRRLDRVTMTSRALGLIVGVLAAALVAPLGRWGQGVFVAPLVVALGLLAAMTASEMLVWRTARTPGSASLERRTSRDYVSRPRLGVLAGFTAGLAALWLWCAARQNTSPNEFGATGRGWTQVRPDGTSSGGSPFPGTFYSLPAAALVVVLVVLLVLGLALVVSRPRNGADATVVAVDDDARRRSADAMIATVTLGICGLLLFSSLSAAGALEAFTSGGRAAALAMATVATLGGGWAAATIAVPGRAEKVRP